MSIAKKPAFSRRLPDLVTEELASVLSKRSSYEFKDLFDLGELPGEDQGIYQTLAGFVVMQLGRIPAAADHFVWEGLKIEVVDMDGNRVDKILVTPTGDPISELAGDV